MRYLDAVNKTLQLPELALGVMRLPGVSQKEADALIVRALELGINMFDTADIYTQGESDVVLGKALKKAAVKREDIIVQTKASIVPGLEYNASEKHIIDSVNGSLARLDLDYVDILLLHRPDALLEPEEVASAFTRLHEAGKVKYFGVSNYNVMQIELLNHFLPNELKLHFNQMQFSVDHSAMIDTGLNVNRNVESAVDYTGGIIQYSWLNDIRLQAWSPLQKSNTSGTFLSDPDYPELNKKLEDLAAKHNTNPGAVAIAWILKHPAGIQTILGTTKVKHLEEMAEAVKFELTHEEWYELYLSNGKYLP